MRIEKVEPRKTQKKRKNQNQELRQEIAKSTVSSADEYEPQKKAIKEESNHGDTGTTGQPAAAGRNQNNGRPQMASAAKAATKLQPRNTRTTRKEDSSHGDTGTTGIQHQVTFIRGSTWTKNVFLRNTLHKSLGTNAVGRRLIFRDRVQVGDRSRYRYRYRYRYRKTYLLPATFVSGTCTTCFFWEHRGIVVDGLKREVSSRNVRCESRPRWNTGASLCWCLLVFRGPGVRCFRAGAGVGGLARAGRVSRRTV